MSGDGVATPAVLGDKSAALALTGVAARQPDQGQAEGKKAKEREGKEEKGEQRKAACAPGLAQKAEHRR